MTSFDRKIKKTLKNVGNAEQPPRASKEKIDGKVLQYCPEFRKKVAVIFGGCSPEYSVSLQSAYAILTHIDRSKYVPIMIGISPDGEWFLFDGDIEKIPADTWRNHTDCTPVAVSQNRRAHDLLLFGKGRVQKQSIDVAFPVLHGKNGEDGTVQGLFELAGIPVVGCGVLASALCMDKDKAHKLVHAAGVAVPNSFVCDKSVDMESIAKNADKIGYPLFVKPVRAGSSYGISKVAAASGLTKAVAAAFQYDEKIIIEECITGFEVGCAVMGERKLTVGEVDEIELTDGFFDYTEKYTLKTSAIHVPARVSSEVAARIKETARTIYKTLDCQGFARVDMFLTGAGEIVFNEVNTIPGFTTHSRFPTMMKAVGLTFEQIVSTVIEEATAG